MGGALQCRLDTVPAGNGNAPPSYLHLPSIFFHQLRQAPLCVGGAGAGETDAGQLIPGFVDVGAMFLPEGEGGFAGAENGPYVRPFKDGCKVVGYGIFDGGIGSSFYLAACKDIPYCDVVL